MKNTFGNVNSPMNIATFEIKIKLQETFSCIFTNDTWVYQQWYRFQFYDAFIQIIPDDYYVYNEVK